MIVESDVWRNYGYSPSITTSVNVKKQGLHPYFLWSNHNVKIQLWLLLKIYYTFDWSICQSRFLYNRSNFNIIGNSRSCKIVSITRQPNREFVYLYNRYLPARRHLSKIAYTNKMELGEDFIAFKRSLLDFMCYRMRFRYFYFVILSLEEFWMHSVCDCKVI